jgi:HEPN domain-containing protein
MTVPPKHYWLTGTQYLNLVECALSEATRQGNPWGLVSSHPLTFKEVEDRTKWSDHRIGIPILFNFFHGIELWLKAALLEKGIQKSGHRLTELFNNARSVIGPCDFFDVLEPFIHNIKLTSILGEFLSENKITIDSFYEALKYPELKNGSDISHDALLGRTELGLNFYNEIINCIKLLRPAARAMNLLHSGKA